MTAISARIALAAVATCTFSGHEFRVRAPGAIELAELIGEHPDVGILFDGGGSRLAAGGRSVVALAKLCVEDQPEDFEAGVRRASFKEVAAFVRTVLGLFVGDDGLGPFVREDLAPALLVIAGQKRAAQVAALAEVAEIAIDAMIDQVLDQAAKSLPGIKAQADQPQAA
jgi:hypothetical protein